MRFERTDLFKADYKRLTDAERKQFRNAVILFNSACDRFVGSNNFDEWPGALRVKSVVNAPGVFEIIWSFKNPDGRATWEWITIVDESGQISPAVRWRRLGKHRIFKNP